MYWIYTFLYMHSEIYLRHILYMKGSPAVFEKYESKIEFVQIGSPVVLENYTSSYTFR